MKVTIYHNPRCSKSRQTLQIIKDQEVDVTVVEYLKSPPDAETLRAILNKLGIEARDLLRKGEQAYKEGQLGNPDLSEDDLIAAMVANPILIERPVVVHNDRAVIGRPPEKVLDLLT